MEWIFGLVALVAALAGLVTAVGHGGYVYLLGSVARKRAGGAPIARYARGRYLVAGLGLLAGLVAVLIAVNGAGYTADTVALLLGLGTAGGSAKSLRTSREGLRLGGHAPR